MKIRIESSFKSKDKDQKLKKTFNWVIDEQAYNIDLDTIENKVTITADYECKYVTSKMISKLNQIMTEEILSKINLKKGDKVKLPSLDFENKNEEFIDEYKNLYLDLHHVLSDFSLLLKFHLRKLHFRDPRTKNLSRLFYYDEDENKWRDAKLNPLISTTMGVYKQKHINQRFLNSFDQLIKQGERSLVAFRYLNIGANTNDPKAIWISTTTALEIAIKEILIRVDPKLEKLLSEINSPPLPKMYKGILHSITGYESPYYKEIDKGAQIRNKIIHRPKLIKIENQDSLNYLYMANCAIDHLLQVVKCYKSSTVLRYKKDDKNKVQYGKYLNS